MKMVHHAFRPKPEPVAEIVGISESDVLVKC